MKAYLAIFFLLVVGQTLDSALSNPNPFIADAIDEDFLVDSRKFFEIIKNNNATVKIQQTVNAKIDDVPADEGSGTTMNPVEPSGSGTDEPSETTTTTTTTITTTTTQKVPVDTTTTPRPGSVFVPVVTGSLAVASVKVGNVDVKWTSELASLNNKLAADVAAVFEKELQNIYTKAKVAFTSIKVTQLSQDGGSYFRSALRSLVRATDGIKATYKATLVAVGSAVDEDALVASIQKSVNDAVNSMDLSQSFGAPITSAVIGIKTEVIPPYVDTLDDGEIAAIIVGSVLGGLVLIILVGYILFRSHNQKKTAFEDGSSRTSSSSSSSDGKKSVPDVSEVLAAPPPVTAQASNEIPMTTMGQPAANSYNTYQYSAMNRMSLPRVQVPSEKNKPTDDDTEYDF